MGFYRAVCFAVALVLGVAIVQPVSVATAVEVCNSPSPGRDLPVIPVHGLGGKLSAFGDAKSPQTLLGAIEALPNAKVYPFEYEDANFRWVDHPSIGPRLVRLINCLAIESRKAGGPGKVAVVAHSMGGLATRWAAANGAGPNIGLLVTIGTPNTGSGVANVVHGSARQLCEFYLHMPSVFYVPPTLDKVACEALLNQVSVLDAIQGLQRYSRELAALPWMPRSTHVVAIAGNVRRKYMNFTFVPVDGKPFNSDLVVSKESALSHSDEGWDIGCASFIPVPEVGDAVCDHTKLLKNEAVKIRVKAAITEYQKSLQPKPTPTPSPKPPSPTCPSPTEYARMTSQAKGSGMPDTPGAKYEVKGEVICDGAWAVAFERVTFPNGLASEAMVVFQHNGKAWVFNAVGTDFGGVDCREIAPKVRARMRC